MNLLITGGYGFIGSNLIRLIHRERPSWRIVNLDLVTYAANPSNLEDIQGGRHYEFIHGDIANRSLVSKLFATERFDGVVHCAAESHVDRSIHDSGQFLRTNVEGTLVLLEAASVIGNTRHVQVSTDEVYGSLEPDDPPFTEQTPLAPRSPYSASKAAADLMTEAFHHTHGLNVVITRCSNNYGPYQHPEKLIPLMITAALRGMALPIYGDGRQRRDWIFVGDHCEGLLGALEHGARGQTYNFGGNAERANIDVVRQLLHQVGASESLITYVADRPGHDRRYSMNFDKASTQLGWAPKHTFEDGLRQTVSWYRQNSSWWESSAESAYSESRERIRRWGTGALGSVPASELG
jgi:dTDP-glucose 4,6-dehydratase